MLGVLVFRLSLAISKLGDPGHSSASASLSFSGSLGQTGIRILIACPVSLKEQESEDVRKLMRGGRQRAGRAT